LIPSQDITVSFLGRRGTRNQLSLEILNTINPAGDTDREKINHLTNQEKDCQFALNRFLEDADAEDTPAQPVSPTAEPSQEIYGIGDDDSDGGDEDKDEDQYEDILPKLQATREFLRAGPAFVRYKDRLRRFLQPASEAIDLELFNSSSHTEDEQATKHQSQYFDYDFSLNRPSWLAITDSCKRRVEAAAGCQLSCWPLSEPEKDLMPGSTRVYSMPFKRNRRFFDDLPTPIAESLFPKLLDVRASTAKSRWAALGREAVYLKNSTLMHLLHRREDQGSQHQDLQSFSEESSHDGSPKRMEDGSPVLP